MVSDVATIIITTNFINTVSETHTIALEDIGTPDNLQKLRWLFFDPAQLRPGMTTAAITEKAAILFASLAQTFRERGHDPHLVAHFLNRLLFCFFAEDVELLPSRLFTRVLENGAKDPERATRQLTAIYVQRISKGGDARKRIILNRCHKLDSPQLFPRSCWLTNERRGKTMKKIILIVAMCVLSNSALAGTYSQANRAQQACESMGEFAVDVFQRLKAGKILPPLPESVTSDPKTNPVFVRTIADVTEDIDSLDAQKAHMIGWSHCMDYASQYIR